MNILHDSAPYEMTVVIYGMQRTASTLTHALLACSVANHGDSVEWVLAAPDTAAAKVRARSRMPNPHWMQIKRDVHQGLLRLKFQNPAPRRALLAASPREVIGLGLAWLREEIGGGPAEIAPEEVDLGKLLGAGGEASVTDARQRLFEALEGGQDCALCGQFAKVYRRGLGASIVADVIRIYRTQKDLPEGAWVDIATVRGVRGGDYAKAEHWGLLEHAIDDGTSRKQSGLWRVTEEGIEFIEGRGRVIKAQWFYNGEVAPGPWSRDEPLVDVQEALGKKFDFEALMNGTQ